MVFPSSARRYGERLRVQDKVDAQKLKDKFRLED
jgi:hypothetical protein